MRELIVHVGPPKTATTTLQEMLKLQSHNLRQLGISLPLPRGYSSAYGFADIESPSGPGQSTSTIKQGWYDVDGSIDLLPSIDSLLDRVLLSAERFAELSPEGVRRLESWFHPDRIVIVAYVREPVGWMWSGWQQTCKTPGWSEWLDYVDYAIAEGLALPSVFLRSWQAATAPVEVCLIPLESPRGPWGNLIAAIGAEGDLPPEVDPEFAALNQSMGPVEQLLTAVLVEEVAEDLLMRSWSQFGDLPESFVSRCCLDLVDKSRPAFELAKSLEHEWALQAPVLFDDESVSRVASYRQLWLSDFEDVINSHPQLGDGYREELTQALSRYRLADTHLGTQTPYGHGFPIRGFDAKLRSTPSLIPMARLFAVSVGLQHRQFVLSEKHGS